MTSKEAIRRKLLKVRDGLTSAERRQWNIAIQERFFALPMVVSARRIMLFLAFGSEVDTWLLLDQAIALGKEVVAPVCLPETKALALYPITCRTEAEPGHWGIHEPRKVGEPVAPHTLDVVVVPGVAFDGRGNRIGYGGGYYDRFLEQATQAWKVGVCYDLQLLEDVPAAKHDIPVDVLVTETQTIIMCEVGAHG
ncbi:MAG: 5-formyltetrahydrofolate cyclo-ligase [Firmicutes bacterium]|nr:5-formyltetrahydrofolate cyclo-ligase [Bacillota bacterium]